jgi:hypothetical protein
MSFIGIITEKKEEKKLEEMIKKSFKNGAKKHTIIVINENSIENLVNIKFETILLNSTMEVIKNKEKLKKILSNTKYFVVNSDLCDMELIQNLKLTVISYGYNNKATITMSSIDDEEMILCIQRGIKNLQGDIIEPQEISIALMEEEMNHYLKMGTSIVELLYK